MDECSQSKLQSTLGYLQEDRKGEGLMLTTKQIFDVEQFQLGDSYIIKLKDEPRYLIGLVSLIAEDELELTYINSADGLQENVCITPQNLGDEVTIKKVEV